MTIATQATGRQWIVASESKPDTLYTVKKVGSTYSCDCAGHYRWSRCKHADAVRKAQPAPTVDPAKVEMAKRLGLMAS